MKKIFYIFIALLAIFVVANKALNVKAASAPELIDGAQIRTDNNAGIKFVASATPTDGAVYGFVVGRGTITDLTVETPDVVTGEATGLSEENKYWVTITKIPEYGYAQDLSVRAYVRVGDQYTYSENIVTRSVGQVALGAQVNGTDGEYIQNVASYMLANYKKVHVDYSGNTHIDNVLYETNHKVLGQKFIADWNAMFETTLDAETAFVQGDNYASPFRTSARNNSTTDPSGAKIAEFFRDETMYNKWGWILDYIKTELKSGLAYDPCVTQIDCILNNTTDETGNWYYGITLVSYLQSIFNGKGTSTGSGRFNFERSVENMQKLALIGNYNDKVYSTFGELKLVKIGDDLQIEEVAKENYVFEGYMEDSTLYDETYKVASTNTLLIATYSALEYNITYELNGGGFRYASLDDAIDDFINDYNEIRGTTYTAETFAALGASADIGGASHVLYGRISSSVYDENIKNKWMWLVNYIADVAGSANKAAFTNFYNYSNQSELNAANTNYIYCIAYELRGWVGQAQYTKNTNFKSADYSALVEQSTTVALGETEYKYNYGEERDLLIPTRTGYDFMGWKCSVSDEILMQFPGKYYNTNSVTYTAVWERPTLYVDPTATTGSIYEVNNKQYVYGKNLFSTITDALAAAEEYYTISLLPGTYAEDITISTANITLAGPNEGIAYNESRGEEAIISGTITVSANNFTLDGVKYTGTQIIASKALAGLSILNVISTGNGGQIMSSGGRQAVLGSNYDLSDLVIKYSSFYMPSSQSGKNALAFYGVVTNANIEYNKFENTLSLSTYTEPILLNKVAGKIYVSNNNIDWSTDNYAIFLGSGSNAATVIDIKDNVVNCSNTTYHTAGIAVRNVQSGVTVNIVGNKIYNMGGNTFNFKSSVSGANVNISYNYFDANTSFKLTDFGSATVTTNNNCYAGGITSAGYNPNTSTETTYADLALLEEAYAKVK